MNKNVFILFAYVVIKQAHNLVIKNYVTAENRYLSICSFHFWGKFLKTMDTRAEFFYLLNSITSVFISTEKQKAP